MFLDSYDSRYPYSLCIQLSMFVYAHAYVRSVNVNLYILEKQHTSHKTQL